MSEPLIVKYGPDDKYEAEFTDLTDLLVSALRTDGDHHKQWYLFLALKATEPRAAELYDRIDGDIGIPP